VDVGILMFVTERSLPVTDLAPACEERGIESLWVPEHPIVPVEHARELALATGATLWETDVASPGPFGTHIQSYLRQPREYVERLTGFFDGVLDAEAAAPAA